MTPKKPQNTGRTSRLLEGNFRSQVRVGNNFYVSHNLHHLPQLGVFSCAPSQPVPPNIFSCNPCGYFGKPPPVSCSYCSRILILSPLQSQPGAPIEQRLLLEASLTPYPGYAAGSEQANTEKGQEGFLTENFTDN